MTVTGNHFVCTLPSPLGTFYIEGCTAGLTRCGWVETGSVNTCNDGVNNHPDENLSTLIDQSQEQFPAYFEGQLQHFDLPIAPSGTSFQQTVWQHLCNVPYGRTKSYGDIAKGLGKPSAARAVGAAIGRNPLAIIVPCHRIIGTNGALTGFASGLDRKRWLLELEETHAIKR